VLLLIKKLKAAYLVFTVIFGKQALVIIIVTCQSANVPVGTKGVSQATY